MLWHRSHFVSEQREHLVYFVYAQRLLTLLQFAHESQSYARLLCQIHLREVEHASAFLHKCGY